MNLQKIEINKILNRFLKDKFIIYSLILGFFGFLDAAYLTIEHYKNITPPCTIHGCETVLTSAFSTIGPIPVALLGALFYLAVMALCLLILIEGMQKLVKFFYLTVAVGFAFSIYLFLLQWLVIKSFCQYCLLSEVISTGLLILSGLKFREDRKTS
jgi:uncharacterized membrane protein